MSHAADKRTGDGGLVLRTLSAILLTGGSLLAAVRDGVAVAPVGLAAGLALLWSALALDALPLRGWLNRRRLDAWQVLVDLAAVGLVVAAAPDAPGLSVFFLGPVANAALRLGREGATAAAALAALGLLLPALARDGWLNPLPAPTTLGAVLLLASGLAAGELVRLAARRRRAELRVLHRSRRTSREVQMILDNLGSGLLTVDEGGRVSRLNPVARHILGLDQSVWAGRTLENLLGRDGAELIALLDQSLADGRPRKRAEVKIRRAGQDVPLGVNVDFLSGEDGALEGAVAVFTDLTEVRRLQDHLRRADRLAGVGELAASIAHELRNPLASIRGSVEMLAGDLELTGHHAQLMQLILRESARLNTIITDFLAFARMRPAQPQPIALDRFLEEVLLQLRQHVSAHAGRVTVSCAKERSGIVLHADSEQLVQALLNLGINACEAMHYDGELRLDVTARDGACELRVADTGPGLEPGRAEEIFTPFVTTKQQGTGLGLPMVARIVHGHGGTVEAGNTPAGGAEFILRLPLAATTPATGEVAATCRETVAAVGH
ncbi:MAG TPA: ATP-binding protein [Candidatus Krumholzibacteria bacterium]|nr:ATP-binding protein [Candidatus Krumholzibacteria bacterium]HPD71458.1 ATP-binding protein [Candidatus Krumholzibacteria bacterium]HRY41609.1 ATP-binding protein [Candidatus Krumholzibacteria bacterium]